MTIEAKKMRLIQRIIETEDPALLEKLNEVAGIATTDADILAQLSSPIQPLFDLEAIKREQNYQPTDKATLNRIIQEADIQEPIEELLEMARQ
ncbi:MAG: hypothetical protein ACK4TA_10890 [Saprospiraceae bacterium]